MTIHSTCSLTFFAARIELDGWNVDVVLILPLRHLLMASLSPTLLLVERVLLPLLSIYLSAILPLSSLVESLPSLIESLTTLIKSLTLLSPLTSLSLSLVEALVSSLVEALSSSLVPHNKLICYLNRLLIISYLGS